MKDIIIICLLLLVIIFWYLWKKKNIKTIEINKNTINQQKILNNEIENLKKQKDNIILEIENLNNSVNNTEQITQNAFSQYQKVLDNKYKEAEEEFDTAINVLKMSYEKRQDKLLAETGLIEKDLDKLFSTRAAALEAQLKEQEIKDKKSFYCPQIKENDLKDVKILKDIEYKLNDTRILRMLIWQSYYQKPMNQVCANVLGSSTAEVCGIYKITNQLNNFVYIGQSTEMATRWKNHAKAGLGIDTPAGNKLYQSMISDGLENFSFELLEKCKKEELNEKEKFYINLYQSNQFGFNSQKGNE